MPPAGVMAPLEIVPRRRFRAVLPLVLVTVATAVSAYVLLAREPAVDAGEAPGLRASRQVLRQQVDALLAEREGFARRVAILERERQVERAAYDEVDKQLVALQDQVLDLREQVAFYEAIVSSPATSRLTVQTVHLERQGTANAWRFQLVLTRNTKSDNVLSGSVELEVHGEEQGEVRQLSFSDLTADRAGTLVFQFRYFQRLEGRLILPPAFEPQRVLIRVIEDGVEDPPVERSFDWPAQAAS